ncbi:MAG: hypothetical protein HY695_35835 [Deltaproteobacteria bacterium]|nr:hypothetical protein [Deltaproteobacteria bacterium]
MEQLRSNLDEDASGEAIAKLEKFRDRYSRFHVSTIVSQEIAKLRAQVKGRFHVARELAREGELERAEKIIRDLAHHFAATDDGRWAKEFLGFDFYLWKANHLIRDQRFDEAEESLNELFKKYPAPARISEAERMLDAITQAQAGRARTVQAQARSASVQLQVLLRSYYRKHRRYPGALALDQLDLDQPIVQSKIKGNLSAISDYQFSDGGFSLITVAKDGKTRFRVTQGEITAVD